MSSPFPPHILAVLPDRMLQSLAAARDAVGQDHDSIRQGRKSLNASISVLNRIFESIWTLWVYPQWPAVGGRWDGPSGDDVTATAWAVLATWDAVCEQIRVSGPPPHYACSAGVRAATLRRAGLGQPVEALTPFEWAAVQEALSRYSPGSDGFGPALWHAHDLGFDLAPAAELLEQIPAPKASDSDFKSHFARVLHDNLAGANHNPDLPRLRGDLANCGTQHYAWVAETGVDSLPLCFAAAFNAGLESANPGILSSVQCASVRFALGLDAISHLRG